MSALDPIVIDVPVGKLEVLRGDSIFRVPSRRYELRSEHLVAIGDPLQAVGDEATLGWTVRSRLGERGELHLVDHDWPNLAHSLVLPVRDICFRLSRGHLVVLFVAAPVRASPIVAATLLGLGLAPSVACEVARGPSLSEEFGLDDEVGVCGAFRETLASYDAYWAKKRAAQQLSP